MRNMPRPSPMIRKFMSANASNRTDEEIMAHSTKYGTCCENGTCCEEGWPQDPIRDEQCFFYGSLMNPQILSHVLELSKSPPIMRRARVTGYQIKLWGRYPAFVEGQTFHFVDGMVCEPLSPTQLDRLAAYETDKYRRLSCLIEVLNDDGSIKETIEGITFAWNGRQDELQEGTFDSTQWKKARRLRDLD
ncbi:hypothetical protein N7492_007813 [Penicillium capsulatum]|uniref:Putative gamma-glutamylcyclotransferase n=1 Tax=Penicillium capsulatum TaxID=69766 RepID=A0A9W9LMH7_9EURO|nr:hypothetical protein N7492_007813 [Penicillium capsulatum]KAJ6117643.1 hypothetical protein N7512_007368 [Penicillium capsulatum]